MVINIKTVRDDRYRFVHTMDLDSGFYYRTGIFDQFGHETDQDPFMAQYPHLLDVGIMGHCVHGKSGLCLKAGVQCYQDGLHKEEPNMSVDDFQMIMDQSRGKLHQVALGGRGDPDMHEDFEAIVASARTVDIVPNLTTSGFGLTKENVKIMKRYCGAVAVSWYRSSYTLQSIDMLLSYGIKTNIHYVLGNNSIDEAIAILENDSLPEGINRIIFLLHKPVGLGTQDQVLQISDPKVAYFFSLFQNESIIDRAGFDSCTVPGLINHDTVIHEGSLDTCEAARFSAYIAPDMMMTPCSFDQEYKWGISLREYSIQDAWEHKKFNDFRNTLQRSCPYCSKRASCLGGCPIKKEIVLCKTLQEGN